MNKIALKLSVKKKRIVLYLFLLFSLFISENGIAWNIDHFEVSKNLKNNYIKINTRVYKYDSGKFSQAYLKQCRIEASDDDRNYYSLMDINTQWATKVNPKTTTIYLGGF